MSRGSKPSFATTTRPSTPGNVALLLAQQSGGSAAGMLMGVQPGDGYELMIEGEGSTSETYIVCV